MAGNGGWWLVAIGQPQLCAAGVDSGWVSVTSAADPSKPCCPFSTFKDFRTVTLQFRAPLATPGTRGLAVTLTLTLTLTFTLIASCATAPEAMGPLRAETVVAVTDAARLIRFNAGQPQRILHSKPLQGLAPGNRLIGIDYRVARGVLYAVSASGHVYTLDADSAQLTRVGSGAPVVFSGQHFGVDFNPVADRIRVVSDSGQNLRLHPDSGALAAADPALRLSAASTPAAGGVPPRIAGAAYTYNKHNDKLSTNFAIDLTSGTLLVQGSREGVVPVVSPNSGELGAVGALGTGALDDAAFDIADLNNAALAALRSGGRTRLHAVDLASGRATLIGTVGDGSRLWGMAIVP